MRLALVAAAFVLTGAIPAFGQASVEPSAPSSPAQEAQMEAEMDAMMEHDNVYRFLLGEFDYARERGRDLFTWDVDGWVGGDYNKLWLKSEGELFGGEVEDAEVQALYSRNVSTYFDAQAGVRYDFEPTGTAYLVFGVQGLAPYFFETDAAAFVSDKGDVSLRAEQSLDLLLTQRLVLQPRAEANLFLQDIPEQGVGSGLSTAEGSLQLRYEVTRKFAPYVDLNYERAFGDTKRFRRAEGEGADAWTLRAGVRLWF